MTTPFDQLLRESLKPPPQAPGQAAAGADRAEKCLDAETLAAWSEGTLDAAGRAEVEAHASSCGRCQALLAAMVRIEPVAAVRPWWRSPALGWLAPLTVAAAALAIWVRLGPSPSPQQVAMAPAVATQPPAGPNAQGLPANQPPPELRRSADTLPKKEAGGRQAAAGRAEAEGREALRDRPSETSERARPAERLEVRTEPAAPVPPAAMVIPPASSPAPARERASAAVDALKPPLTDTSAASSKQANATAPAAPPAAAAPPTSTPPAPAPIAPVAPMTRTALAESPGAAAGSRVASFSADQQEVMVQTADGVTRWRVTSQGTVQRSTDAGVRWVTQPSGDPAIVTAGAAPSSTVCWLVGRGGVVLLTTDGRVWRKVPFPQAVDLVAVTATDERTATVTAAGGRRFTTTDGGGNWK